MNPDRSAAPVRVTVRAKPNSRVESITWAGEVDDVPLLDVKVRAKAVDGAANEAVIAALAAWFGLPRSAVTIVRGATARVKHVHIAGGPGTASRLADLKQASPT